MKQIHRQERTCLFLKVEKNLQMMKTLQLFLHNIFNIKSSCNIWKSIFRKNPCYMTKQAAFEVTEKVLLVMKQLSSAQTSHATKEITNGMTEALNEVFQTGIHNKQTLCCVPGFVEYMTIITKLDLQMTLKDGKPSSAADIAKKVQSLLGSELYEVRLVVLDMLASIFTEHKQCKEHSEPPVTCPVTMTTMSSAAIDGVMSLLPYLLERALHQEQHFECQIKVRIFFRMI